MLYRFALFTQREYEESKLISIGGGDKRNAFNLKFSRAAYHIRFSVLYFLENVTVPLASVGLFFSRVLVSERRQENVSSRFFLRIE